MSSQTPSRYLWGTKFRILSDNMTLKSIGNAGNHNARVQRWLEVLTAFCYTLEYRKRRANGNADFLSRLSEPATEHDRSGSASLNPLEDGGIYLIRVSGLNTSSLPIPGVVSGGLVPRTERAGLSGLVPLIESAVLGEIPLTSTDCCDFRTHGPRMKVDDLCGISRSFVARVSASVTPPSIAVSAAGGPCLQPITMSLRFLPYPPRSARVPQKPRLPRRPSPSGLLQGFLHRGPTRSRPQTRPRPPLFRLALRRPRR